MLRSNLIPFDVSRVFTAEDLSHNKQVLICKLESWADLGLSLIGVWVSFYYIVAHNPLGLPAVAIRQHVFHWVVLFYLSNVIFAITLFKVIHKYRQSLKLYHQFTTKGFVSLFNLRYEEASRLVNEYIRQVYQNSGSRYLTEFEAQALLSFYYTQEDLSVKRGTPAFNEAFSQLYKRKNQ